MLRLGIELVLASARAAAIRSEKHPWYVLIELPRRRARAARGAGGDPGRGLERGLIEDATIADSLEQAKMFWRIRETVRRGAAPRGRLDQARRLGAGRGGAGLHREATQAVTA
jgi:hypothetical protein